MIWENGSCQRDRRKGRIKESLCVQDGTGRDGTGRDGTGRDGTGRDGTGRDGTGRDGTGRDGTGRDGTGRDGTGRDGTGRGRDGTGRDGTGRDGTGRDGTGRDGTGRDGTGRDGTGRDGTGRDGIVQCYKWGQAKLCTCPHALLHLPINNARRGFPRHGGLYGYWRELLFADDSALVAHSAEEMQKIVNAFSYASKKLGLKTNIKKTEVLYQPKAWTVYRR